MIKFQKIFKEGTSDFPDYYLNTVAGATEEKYDGLSPYDAFVYIETYIKMAGSKEGAVFEHYVQTVKSGVEDYCKLRCAAWKGNNVDEVKAAFRDLVEWQFAYIREKGYPYNFITGKSYAEEMGLATEEATDSSKETTNEAGLTDEEVEDILSELSEEEIKEIKEEFAEESDKDFETEIGASGEDSSDQTTIGVEVSPLIILVLLVVVVVVVILYNKKKGEKK